MNLVDMLVLKFHCDCKKKRVREMPSDRRITRHIDAGVKDFIKQIFSITIKMMAWCKSNLRSNPGLADALKLCLGLYAIIKTIKAVKEITPLVANKVKEIKEYNEEIYRKYGEEFKPLGNMLRAQREVIKGLLAVAAAIGVHAITRGGVSPETARKAAEIAKAAHINLAREELAKAGKRHFASIKILRSSLRGIPISVKKIFENKANKEIANAEQKIKEAERAINESKNKSAKLSNVMSEEKDLKKISEMTSEAELAKLNAEKKVSEAVDSVNKTCKSLEELSDKCNEAEPSPSESEKISKEFAKFVVNKYNNEIKPIANEIIKIARSTKEKLYYGTNFETMRNPNALFEWLNELNKSFVKLSRTKKPSVSSIISIAGHYELNASRNALYMYDSLNAKHAEGFDDNKKIGKLLERISFKMSEISKIGLTKVEELKHLGEDWLYR